jgi:hypothetical protein
MNNHEKTIFFLTRLLKQANQRGEPRRPARCEPSVSVRRAVVRRAVAPRAVGAGMLMDAPQRLHQRQPPEKPQALLTSFSAVRFPPQTQALCPQMSAAAAAAARTARRLLACRLQTTTTRLLHASTRLLPRAPSLLPLSSFDLLSASTACAARRQIAFSFQPPPWPAGSSSQGAAREASGSFIHPAAIVHPDASIGQVKPPPAWHAPIARSFDSL